MIAWTKLATPHSQRSVARISVADEADPRNCGSKTSSTCARRAVPTETQVMVKREDEQAFAELNAANPIFVEDAARSVLRTSCKQDERIGDFRVIWRVIRKACTAMMRFRS